MIEFKDFGNLIIKYFSKFGRNHNKIKRYNFLTGLTKFIVRLCLKHFCSIFKDFHLKCRRRLGKNFDVLLIMIFLRVCKLVMLTNCVENNTSLLIKCLHGKDQESCQFKFSKKYL